VINNEVLGCSDRSASFPSNTWQKLNEESDSNYTYFLPLTYGMAHKQIEVYIMLYDDNNLDIVPHVFLTSDDPYNNNILTVIK